MELIKGLLVYNPDKCWSVDKGLLAKYLFENPMVKPMEKLSMKLGVDSIHKWEARRRHKAIMEGGSCCKPSLIIPFVPFLWIYFFRGLQCAQTWASLHELHSEKLLTTKNKELGPLEYIWKFVEQSPLYMFVFSCRPRGASWLILIALRRLHWKNRKKQNHPKSKKTHNSMLTWKLTRPVCHIFHGCRFMSNNPETHLCSHPVCALILCSRSCCFCNTK